MQKSVEFTHNGAVLRGMVHIPENGKEKYPFVAMYHGFTGNKMEPQFMFVRLSRELEKHGIGSIRFDFSGCGESDGTFETMTASREIDEAKAIFNYMSQLPYADKENLFMLGLSMGGFVSSIASAEVENVKALVLWAPAGNMEQIAENSIKNSKVKNDEKGYADIGGLLLGYEFLEDIKRINVYERAAKFKGDVLIIHGADDGAVPLDASYKYLEEYGNRAALIIIEGAGHTFQRVDLKDRINAETKSFICKHF